MADQREGGAASAPLRFGSLAQRMPSIDWALARLTGTWAEDGEMISCPLPGHEDSTPSFNLWAAGEDGVPLRFGCFGCGRGGDVIELVSILEGISTEDALQRAAELAEEEDADQTPRKRSVRAPKPVIDLTEEMGRLRESMDVHRIESFQRYMTDKRLGGEELQLYAMEEWGWAPAAGGAVAVPHLSRDGIVTGIKYRRPTAKFSADGSTFDSLYGSWRDRGRKIVVLCEGETDTLWAAWSLRDEPSVDVLGLPAGAQQDISADWMQQLTDRVLLLAFDSDDAGMAAARKWAAARPDAKLARLPEGEDLLSCGVPVVEVLQGAEVPRRDMGSVVASDGSFVRVSSKDGQQVLTPISDFSFEPIRELKAPEGPAWEVRLSDRVYPVLLRAQDLNTPTSFTRWANRHGCAWLGTGTTVQSLLNYVKAKSSFLPLEVVTTRAGKIRRSYVGPGFCIGPDRMRYVPPPLGDSKLEGKLQIGEETAPFDPMSVVALEQLNDPAVMATILGWLCATLLRGRRAPAPPLFISGESGSGKTNLLQATLGSLGFGIEANLTTTTPYGVDCLVNSVIGFPVWFDEYRRGAREDSMQRLRQLLRDAYYGQPSMKGGMTQQATELTTVETWAGIVVSGEMGSTETSHRDRIVMIDLDRDKRNRDALAFLGGQGRTTGLGHALLSYLARRPEATFKPQPIGSVELPDRFRETLGFIRAGWDAWTGFRWNELRLSDRPVGPDYDSLAGIREETEDPWLEALRACEGVKTRDYAPIVQRDGDDVLIIPSEVIVEARRVGIELPARANELVAWLRKRYVIVDERVEGRRAKRVKGMSL